MTGISFLNISMIDTIPFISPRPSIAALNAMSALTSLSIPSATSSGETLSIQFSTACKRLTNTSLFRKSASASETLLINIIRPSPTVSANGSKCSQNCCMFALSPSQSTLLLKSTNTCKSSGSPFSSVHFPSGSSTIV